MENHRWGPLLVDAHWHAFCQAMYQGIEGQEWEATHHHHKGLHQVVGTTKLGDNQKARALWTMKAAKNRPSPSRRHSGLNSNPIGLVGRTLFLKKSPVAPLAKALECLEVTNEC